MDACPTPSERMKVIIAGSRDIVDMIHVERAVYGATWAIAEVVCGEARGVDRLGKVWARRQGIPVASFPADWDAYGNKAGTIRNNEMARYADALIAVWDGVSPGTRNMIDVARLLKLFVHVHLV